MHLRHETSLLSTPLPFWTYFITLGKGLSINNVASLEGGRGAKLMIWGDMREVGVKENPISSIQYWQIMIFFENVLIFH